MDNRERAYRYILDVLLPSTGFVEYWNGMSDAEKDQKIDELERMYDASDVIVESLNKMIRQAKEEYEKNKTEDL